MASSTEGFKSDDIGLEKSDSSKQKVLNFEQRSSSGESSKTEGSMDNDKEENEHSVNNSNEKKVVENDTEIKLASNCKETNFANNEAMKDETDQEQQEGSGIHSKETNREEGNAQQLENNANEDDKLLSDISELVDQKHNNEKEGVTGDEAENVIDFQSRLSDENNDSENIETEDKMEVELDNNLQEGVDHNMVEEADETSNHTSGDRPLENSVGLDQVSEINCEMKNDLDNITQLCERPNNQEDLETKTDELKKLSSNESAFQKLASLGVIAEAKPVAETKESILKKLASRGGISITPASKGLGSSVSSTVTIRPVSNKPPPVKQGLVKPAVVEPTSATSTSVTPMVVMPTTDTLTKAKYKPGPKSAKAKRMKIDQSKSLDIDKDFNSLINFLSTGADSNNTSAPSSTTDDKSAPEESVTENLNNSKPEIQLDINEASNDQSTNDDHGSGMDIDVNDDRSLHETDSESHDGSKSFEHSSENDEKIPTISKNKNVIEEGSAEILLSANKNVFYNKVQEFNRDMSIAALTVFSEMHQQDPRTRNRGQKRKAVDSNEADADHADGTDENVFEAGKKSENGITILEALSATGLRSIRYAREIPGVKEVIANDLSEDAVDTIKKNVEHNGVGYLVSTTMSDASLLMYQHQASQEWYDAVDLDPYGCPARFLDAAVQAVRDGGLLLVTCTDMAILAGNSPESCYVKYGAVSLRMPACHEMGLRIALQCIESHANRYGRYIVPLLSFSADFYIRLIVQVYTSPVTCKRTTSKLSMVYQCVGCGTHSFHPLGQTSQIGHNTQPKFSLAHGPPVSTNCFHCHHKHFIGGPIWTAPLYSNKFLESMLQVVEKGRFGTAKRMQGMLEVIREELPDVPLYYTIAGLCTKLHCQAIPLIDIRSAILNAGYRVSSSHAAPTAIKTNAPSKVIWDIMRCWVHMNPVSQKRLVTGSVPAAIILEPPNLIANFDIHPRARPSSSVRKLVRYQQNPEKNWGPGVRARCNNADDVKDEKRRINQNKNKTKKHVEIIEVVTIDDEDETIEENPQITETAAASSTAATE